MTDYYPCLEARIAGGAFLHESWGGEFGGRLVALCESSWTADEVAKTLAAKEAPDSARYWIVTDVRGQQQHWNRRRVDEAAAKAGATS